MKRCLLLGVLLLTDTRPKKLNWGSRAVGHSRSLVTDMGAKVPLMFVIVLGLSALRVLYDKVRQRASRTLQLPSWMLRRVKKSREWNVTLPVPEL